MQAGRNSLNNAYGIQLLHKELTVQKKLKVLADTISFYEAYCAKKFTPLKTNKLTLKRDVVYDQRLCTFFAVRQRQSDWYGTGYKFARKAICKDKTKRSSETSIFRCRKMCSNLHNVRQS